MNIFSIFCNSRKMNLIQSLVFFGIPGILMFLGARVLVPYLTKIGWPLIISYSLSLWIPILLILFIILTCFVSNKQRNINFISRFRFGKISGKTWLWIIIGFLGVQTLELGLAPTRHFLMNYSFFHVPEFTPELFHPGLQIADGLTTFFGVPLADQWWIVGFWLGWLIVNIGAEELLWRGYALPLQEKVFGKWAWLVNGILWNLLVHMFMPWSFISLIPVSLAVPYLVQKHQNTWIGIIIHGIGNLLVFILIIPGILA